MVDLPPSVSHVLDITDDEAAVRYESRLEIDIREPVRKLFPSFPVLGWSDILHGPEGEVEGGVAGRMG